MRWTCFHVKELSSGFAANAITRSPLLVYRCNVAVKSSGTTTAFTAFINNNNNKISYQSIADHPQTGNKDALFALVTSTLTL